VDNTGSSDPTNRNFAYLMLGGGKMVYASAARLVVMRSLHYWWPNKALQANAKLEMDVSGVAPGTQSIVKWQGKPVFVRHRTAGEISSARADDSVDLRDPQTDAQRTKKPELLVVLGVCTHLGCVPVFGAGDHKGWFCPCHGSHYDLSGRIRKGPAPLNLAVPEYEILDEKTILIG
jgi:ubiquinol-cytochrome c reductase iron-sulfur subunit